ncbi:uncharacterized protein LOC110823102 [Carica papaya]|uniref:uncharacterized protein LOC110823102 n=1 Tax=Carica papaya TaxID=3649 RepID=UPI000B8C8473|nr:uncharacterized protein LOC110823102 [Carica papaya]
MTGKEYTTKISLPHGCNVDELLKIKGNYSRVYFFFSSKKVLKRLPKWLHELQRLKWQQGKQRKQRLKQKRTIAKAAMKASKYNNTLYTCFSLTQQSKPAKFMPPDLWLP